MFSYRHAFHAGNHADVLKHLALIACLKHLTEKDAALMVLDTHAGAGLYRLDGDYANTSAEAEKGFLRLNQHKSSIVPSIIRQQFATKNKLDLPTILAKSTQEYLDFVASFNKPGSAKIYPRFAFHRPAVFKRPRQAQGL